jgi:hypothetical protein
VTDASGSLPSILFLTSNTEDYLSNSLFHGLRTLLGERVVDFPKSEISYRDYPHLDKIYGRGFTLYGLLEDLPIDRTLVLDRARQGGFDLIVFGDIRRYFGSFVELLPALGGSRIAFLDGADYPAPYPYGSSFWRVPQWWTLPRAHRRGVYFKRELTEEAAQRRYFMLVPRRLAGRTPFARALRPIAFSIPEEKIIAEPTPKTKQFNAHVVDPEVARRIGAMSSYAFDNERDYYADLQASRFGITTKRTGWDALRHYEIAGNGCVPCFRNLRRKPRQCAPHGLEPERNCLAYTDANDLIRQVEAISEERYVDLQRGALGWAHANSTRRRAAEFLLQMGYAQR